MVCGLMSLNQSSVTISLVRSKDICRVTERCTCRRRYVSCKGRSGGGGRARGEEVMQQSQFFFSATALDQFINYENVFFFPSCTTALSPSQASVHHSTSLAAERHTAKLIESLSTTLAVRHDRGATTSLAFVQFRNSSFVDIDNIYFTQKSHVK